MERRLWRYFDVPMFMAAAALVGLGIALIYSASYPTEAELGNWESPVTRQILYGLVGLVLMVVVAAVDYRTYGNFAPTLYAVVLSLLVIVLASGRLTYGAKRWIDLIVFPLQPSEVAKPLLAIVVAKFLADRQEEVKSSGVFAGSLLLLALPMALVYLQPDLGTAAVFSAVWLGMAIMSGMSIKHLGGLVLLIILGAPLAYKFLMHPYMQERLWTYFNPSADPLGAGYNILQSEISVGSGGLLGRGFMNGTQTQLHFLRIQKTDFIFSVLGEELGFVGAVLLFSLFVILLFRGLRTVVLAQDLFGRLLATGIVMVILMQAFINVGANIRLLPVTGVPLPFISYGGSSLISFLFSLGVLQSIIMRHRRLEF